MQIFKVIQQVFIDSQTRNWGKSHKCFDDCNIHLGGKYRFFMITNVFCFV